MYTVEWLGLTEDDLDNCAHHPYWIKVKQTSDLEYACLYASGKMVAKGIRASKGRVLDHDGDVLITSDEFKQQS